METAHKLTHEESKNLHEEMKILLNDFLIKNIDKKQLIVMSQKVCWIANVDFFILGMMDASFLDLISLTIRGAFENLEIPKLQVNLNKITDEYEIDLVNGYSTNVIKFDTKEFPIICTVGEVKVFWGLEILNLVQRLIIIIFWISVWKNTILCSQNM